MYPASILTRVGVPRPTRAYRTLPALAGDAFASAPRVVGEEPDFQGEVCDEIGRGERLLLRGAKGRLSWSAGIAIRLWRATPILLKSEADRILARDTPQIHNHSQLATTVIRHRAREKYINENGCEGPNERSTFGL